MKEAGGRQERRSRRTESIPLCPGFALLTVPKYDRPMSCNKRRIGKGELERNVGLVPGAFMLGKVCSPRVVRFLCACSVSHTHKCTNAFRSVAVPGGHFAAAVFKTNANTQKRPTSLVVELWVFAFVSKG